MIVSVVITLHHIHRHRAYKVLLGLKREGVRYATATPGFEFILGQLPEELVEKIRNLKVVASIEPVAENASGSFISTIKSIQ